MFFSLLWRQSGKKPFLETAKIFILMPFRKFHQLTFEILLRRKNRESKREEERREKRKYLTKVRKRERENETQNKNI